MDLNSFVGKTFQETELFELISFDIEADRTLWFGVYAHINFKRISGLKILVTDVQIFPNEAAYDTKSRSRNPKAEEWFDISGDKAVCFMFVHSDRGHSAVFFKDKVVTQPWYFWYRDPSDKVEKPSQEDIALAFAELAGLLPPDSKPKKSA